MKFTLFGLNVEFACMSKGLESGLSNCNGLVVVLVASENGKRVDSQQGRLRVKGYHSSAKVNFIFLI